MTLSWQLSSQFFWHLFLRLGSSIADNLSKSGREAQAGSEKSKRKITFS